MTRNTVWLFTVILLLNSCSPHSLEDFHREGEARSKTIVALLQGIENYEQLIPLEPVLKKKFDSLIDLLIQARTFQQEHPEQIYKPSSQITSNQLEEALLSIYSMEGGREILERAQQEALVKLDAFERAALKRKSSH